MRGVALVLMMVLSLGLLAACGDDAEEAVEGAVDTATEAVGGAADTATEAAGGAADTATSEAGDAAGGGEATTVEIPAADQGFAYAMETASAAAGTVTLSMSNPSSLQHNIAIEEPEAQEGDVVGMGETSEVTADFPAGEYAYFCTVPGHRDGGMEGTLTVE